jgi:hypothetical protein
MKYSYSSATAWNRSETVRRMFGSAVRKYLANLYPNISFSRGQMGFDVNLLIDITPNCHLSSNECKV